MAAAPTPYVVPPAACPRCRYVADRATIAHGSDAPPEEGDFTVGIRCGAFLQYAAGLSLKTANAIELHRLMKTDRAAWETLAKARFYITQVYGRRN